ncbi:ferritin-like domain-containing protein [uncultured Arcticibacterium sp.]|uniref:ferritin-like domain-containing protein n=1 Tax=uncultured Arcticibacterium sp. TaxID=2173042 RepID=UPI0030FC9BC8
MKRRTTKQWLEYFQENTTQKRIDWRIEPKVTTEERKVIIKSLKAWQLGETSEGHNLIKATKVYADKIQDYDYLYAVKLFIKEEQKHGNNLGRYLDLIGESRISFNWGDHFFRKVRGINTSLEIWTITVLIVETYAQLYYEAVRKTINCPLLKIICKDILIDEAAHIKFQTERLATYLDNNTLWKKWTRKFVYHAFFYGISSAVWIGHRKVFSKAGYSFLTYLAKAKFKFDKINHTLFTARNEQTSPAFQPILATKNS